MWSAAGRLWRIPEARRCLIGQSFFYGLLSAEIAVTFTSEANFSRDDLLRTAVRILGGLVLGFLLAGFQKHPRRQLGLVSFGATGLAAVLLLLAIGVAASAAMIIILACLTGLIIVPLSACLQANLAEAVRGSGTALCYVARAVSIALFAALILAEVVNPEWQHWLLAGLAALAALWTWWAFFRETLELTLELLLVPMYRIRARGPGLMGFPSSGPLIVIANHSAWFDPMWLAKVLPRRLIPMMTSVFYDLPVIRWLMVHVAHAIRVQASTFRREVPELKEAVAVLDRGECLVIFPEGAMRKSADRPLRQFGQGVWHILSERPNTPVVVCWIEGGWGSYFSYCNGLPTKNKRFDFRRPIDVAVTLPRVLPAELLENHKMTRSFLMQACVEARAILGLDVPILNGADSKEEEQTTPS